jgi:cytochrome bd-type quinol oxidase subunit 2
MKKITLFVASIIASVSLLVAVPTASVGAQALDQICNQTGGASNNEVCNRKSDTAPDLINVIINTLSFIIGAAAVIMIMYGGILYATSTGDSGRVKRAKDTIMYSVIGLVISILAFAIVNWIDLVL